MLKMLEIEPLMQDIKLILQKYDNTDRLHEDQIQDLLRQVEKLRGTKLERAPFEDFRKHVDQAFSDLAANYQTQIDRMLNTENYVEKYLPIYINRQLTEVMDIVLLKK